MLQPKLQPGKHYLLMFKLNLLKKLNKMLKLLMKKHEKLRKMMKKRKEKAEMAMKWPLFWLAVGFFGILFLAHLHQRKRKLLEGSRKITLLLKKCMKLDEQMLVLCEMLL